MSKPGCSGTAASPAGGWAKAMRHLRNYKLQGLFVLSSFGAENFFQHPVVGWAPSIQHQDVEFRV